MNQSDTPRVLVISASARQDGSISRKLTADLLAALADRHGDLDVHYRDVAAGVPFINSAWVDANFTPEESRTAQQRQELAYSDELVDELRSADLLVIAAPIYNFSIPATLKAWIDMIARARVTFRYTDSGVEGLLQGKKAYVLAPSGGVPVGSAVDFATPYLRHALGFVGISDVEIIGAPGADRDGGEALSNARAHIAEIIHLAPRAA